MKRKKTKLQTEEELREFLVTKKEGISIDEAIKRHKKKHKE